MHKNAFFFIEKLQKSLSAGASYPDPLNPMAGGFAPRPPLASGPMVWEPKRLRLKIPDNLPPLENS